MEAQGNCSPFARDKPMCLMQQNWTIWTMTILRGSSFPLNGECTTTKKNGPVGTPGLLGFLWALPVRHRLQPHPWPRHRTTRFEAQDDPHSIVVS